jgi:hypothetical protein
MGKLIRIPPLINEKNPREKSNCTMCRLPKLTQIYINKNKYITYL